MKINALSRLSAISTILGVEKTKSNLFSYLETLMRSQEDEIYFVLANQMKLIGHNCVRQAFSILEKLVIHEETEIRNKAIESFIYLGEYMNLSDYNEMVGILNKISSREYFIYKIASIKLIVGLYQKLD